jgi:dUTP pyrophosphatase
MSVLIHDPNSDDRRLLIKTLVLSGPMAGMPESNYPAFINAKAKLKRHGFEVLSPVDCPNEREKAKFQELDRQNRGAEFRSTPEYLSLMKKCLAQVLRADGVATLDGYSSSRGAMWEINLAVSVGMPVKEADRWIAQTNRLSYPFAELDRRGGNRSGICQSRESVQGDASIVAFAHNQTSGYMDCTPIRHYGGDAGFDLYVSQNTAIPGGEFVDVPCGVDIELPPGVWAMITGRSSTLRKKKLLVSQGIIDNGYRGPLFAGVQNLGTWEYMVTRGERIAQLIPMPLTAAELRFVEVDRLSSSDRGTNAFGSTDTVVVDHGDLVDYGEPPRPGEC